MAFLGLTDRAQSVVNELLRRDPPPPLTPSAVWNPELDRLLAQERPETLFLDGPVHPDFSRAFLAGLHLWNDRLDVAHRWAMSQEAVDPLGRQTLDYWHGLMHRREPDYPNAKYWFRRVGDHPLFGQLLGSAKELLTSDAVLGADRLWERIARWERWDPFTVVDLCAELAASGQPEEAALTALQALEMRLLLTFCAEKAVQKE